MSGDDHGTTGELDLNAIEARATLILAEVNREHDWHNPHPGSNLRCRACGLWHGAWSGDGCPGADPEPLPNVSLGLETTLALVAEVRRLRDEAVDERTAHAKVVDNLVAEIERLRAHH